MRRNRFRHAVGVAAVLLALLLAGGCQLLAQAQPPSGPVLSDSAAAARVQRTRWEPRPGNRVPNATVPTVSALRRYYSRSAQQNWGRCDWMRRRVTGRFRGTTDEIIQWAALKWGLAKDLLRAVAVTESNWRQLGPPGDDGISFGLMQLQESERSDVGTYPLSSQSTPFNVDFYGARIRYYLKGCATWLRDTREGDGDDYQAGDLWGSVGAWYSGRWYNRGAKRYIEEVRHHLDQRTWAQPHF